MFALWVCADATAGSLKPSLEDRKNPIVLLQCFTIWMPSWMNLVICFCTKYGTIAYRAGSTPSSLAARAARRLKMQSAQYMKQAVQLPVEAPPLAELLENLGREPWRFLCVNPYRKSKCSEWSLLYHHSKQFETQPCFLTTFKRFWNKNIVCRSKWQTSHANYFEAFWNLD